MIEKNSKRCLKDFIYIDKDRLYSLYSQIFEGVVESIAMSRYIDEENTKTEKRIEQKLIEASFKSQNIVLFDHMYNMLEEEIQSYIFPIEENTVIDNIPIDGIIKVRGKAIVDDYDNLAYFFENYNDIGNALSGLTLLSSANSGGTISKNSIEKYAKDNNLFLEKKYIDSLVKVIRFFHNNNLDLIVKPENNHRFHCCALLNPNGLRISTSEIKNLYGNRPVMDWTVLGQVTNILSNSCKDDLNTGANDSSFQVLFDKLLEVDKMFDKILNQNNNIVKIAPIAVYVEHRSFNVNLIDK